MKYYLLHYICSFQENTVLAFLQTLHTEQAYKNASNLGIFKFFQKHPRATLYTAKVSAHHDLLMSGPAWDYIAKLVCIGDSGTGKSSVCLSPSCSPPPPLSSD